MPKTFEIVSHEVHAELNEGPGTVGLDNFGRAADCEGGSGVEPKDKQEIPQQVGLLLGRLIALSLILAEKCYAEEHNSLETYSLLTGIPIKELADLEVRLMDFMDYRLVIRERDFNMLLAGQVDEVFNERNVRE